MRRGRRHVVINVRHANAEKCLGTTGRGVERKTPIPRHTPHGKRDRQDRGHRCREPSAPLQVRRPHAIADQHPQSPRVATVWKTTHHRHSPPAKYSARLPLPHHHSVRPTNQSTTRLSPPAPPKGQKKTHLCKASIIRPRRRGDPRSGDHWNPQRQGAGGGWYERGGGASGEGERAERRSA